MTNLVEKVQEFGELIKSEKFSFTAVTHHCLADETEVLEKLDMLPSECTYCDLWWAFEDDIYLVDIDSSPDSDALFKYFIFRPGERYNHRFSVITHETPLYTSTIETILSFIASWIGENKDFLAYNRKKKGKKLTKIIYEDIGKQRNQDQ